MTQTIPQTPFALLSGSAGWGIRFPDDLEEPGVRVVERDMSFETPWGAVDHWQLIELDDAVTGGAGGRQVLNVFSHGWPNESIDNGAHRRVAWVLQQAGVKKILADSTCGSLNKAVCPGDFVIPRDILDFSQTQYSLMPGRHRHIPLAQQLFCPALGKTLEDTATASWPTPSRVYGHGTGIVATHNWGPRFTSRAEAQAFRQLGGDVVNQSIGPEASAAREIGACFISASYVVCFEDGIAEETGDGAAIDALHEDLAKVSTRISLHALARATADQTCGCGALLTESRTDNLDWRPGGG